MKPYVVEFRVRAVVMAKNKIEAYGVADDSWSEIRSDEQPIIDVEHVVTNAKQLPTGWDTACIPYGGDGNTCLYKMLDES